MKTDITWKRIGLFVVITFVLTYVLEIVVIGNMMKDPTAAPYLTSVIASMMFLPAVGSAITRLLTKEGMKDFYLKAEFKGKLKYYIMAWFGPTVMIIFGAAVFYLIFPEYFDKNMSYMMDTYKKLGIDMTLEQVKANLGTQILIALLLGPALNVLNAFGEELGWRGYLLPKLYSKIKIVPTLLISGIIWGLWHAPLTIIAGHNYGFEYWGYPYTGILAMCVFSTIVGTFLSYITIKTKSCLAATFAHGALNATASVSIFFLAIGVTENPFIGPLPVGIIGGSGFIIVAIIVGILLYKEEKKATQG